MAGKPLPQLIYFSSQLDGFFTQAHFKHAD